MRVLENIKKVRREKGISQQKMAEKLNISTSTYQKIEQGLILLSVERFLDICRILEIKTYNDLLPPVSADIFEKIEKALIENKLTIENIKNNSTQSQRLVDKLKTRIEKGSIGNKQILDELDFLNNYLEIISRTSMNSKVQNVTVFDLIDLID